MIRRAFTMRLKPDALAEYKHHHDNIWPELVAEIEQAGIASITTFQRDLDLFLVSEIADEAAWDRLWNSAVHRRWAEVMDPLMNLRDDGIVDAGPLVEVFHLATSLRAQPPAASASASEGAAPSSAQPEPSATAPRRVHKHAVRPAKKSPAKKSAGKKPAPKKKAAGKKTKPTAAAKASKKPASKKKIAAKKAGRGEKRKSKKKGR